MADAVGGPPGQGGPAPACPAGHARPARMRGGWLCARCGLRLTPLTADECFEGHARPEDPESWTVWDCPECGVLVLPDDIDLDVVRGANSDPPLLGPKAGGVLRNRLGTFGPDVDKLILNAVGFDPPGPLDVDPSREPAPADVNDTLVTVAAPILAGFALAAIVTIGTSSTAGRPGSLAATVCFTSSAVLLLFSIQVLALGNLAGLRAARLPRWAKRSLHELGLLAFLAGLGLFLWLKTWPAAAVAGVVVVGLAMACDLALVATAWCRRKEWGLPRYLLAPGNPVRARSHGAAEKPG
jgi:hypothetical protein